MDRSGGRRRGRNGRREEARALIARLSQDAERLALRFGLNYRSIEPEHPRVKRRYGVCYSDGSIRIRIHHASTGLPLKYSSLVNTLCHELAHLRHFNHGPRFRVFYERILEFARVEGIYRPALPAMRLELEVDPLPDAGRAAGRARATAARRGSPSSPRPVQLTLFG